MAASTANQQVMPTIHTPSTQKGKRISPEMLVKDTAERKDGTQPASPLEAAVLTMPSQESQGQKHVRQAMESTAETLGIPVQDVIDMASITNPERSEAHKGDSQSQAQSEDEELMKEIESSSSQCLELTLLVILPVETGENAPKARDLKIMKLKQRILSQTIKDAKHKDKIRVTANLERITYNISKEETKIDLTIKALAHIVNGEPRATGWDQTEEPARKKPHHAKTATPLWKNEKIKNTIASDSQETNGVAPRTTVPLPVARPLLNPNKDDDATEIVLRNGTVLVPHDYA